MYNVAVDQAYFEGHTAAAAHTSPLVPATATPPLGLTLTYCTACTFARVHPEENFPAKGESETLTVARPFAKYAPERIGNSQRCRSVVGRRRSSESLYCCTLDTTRKETEVAMG